MDDARVTQVPEDEVRRAEAYMLFYRVVPHPFSLQLEKRAAALARSTQEEEEKRRAASPAVPKKDAMEVESSKSTKTASAASSPDKAKNKEASTPGKSGGSPGVTTRKRSAPDFTDGESWARAKTRLNPASFSSLRKAQDFISENVQFKAAFFKLINDEGSKANAKHGQLSPALKLIGGTSLIACRYERCCLLISVERIFNSNFCFSLSNPLFSVLYYYYYY